jgi:hypothetical protein
MGRTSVWRKTASDHGLLSTLTVIIHFAGAGSKRACFANDITLGLKNASSSSIGSISVSLFAIGSTDALLNLFSRRLSYGQ